MTTQHKVDGSGRSSSGPEHTPRLRLKRKTSRSGHVDGAWWPHSDDLAAELPDLVTVLSVRLGAVTRVTYNVADWPETERKQRMGDQVVRLDGYHRHPLHTVGILDGRGNEIDLLVVPAQTDAEDAHQMMMAAAETDDVSAVEVLLAGGPQGRKTLSA